MNMDTENNAKIILLNLTQKCGYAILDIQYYDFTVVITAVCTVVYWHECIVNE